MVPSPFQHLKTSLLYALIAAPVLAASDSTALMCKGYAYDTERHIPAYIETRQERIQFGKLSATETKFTSPEGKLIADLHLDFVRFPFKPDYAYRDFRNGYEEGATVEASCIRAYFRDSARAVRKEKALDVPEPCVINGGVGEFVKSHWAEITAGKKSPSIWWFRLGWTITNLSLTWTQNIKYRPKKPEIRFANPLS